MVQLEPNLTLTVKHLAPYGALVATEFQVTAGMTAEIAMCPWLRTGVELNLAPPLLDPGGP